MVSVKVKFRPSSVVDMEGSIYYQIIHERKVRQLLTDYKIFPAEWNEKRSAIAIGSVPERKQVLLSINGQIRRDVAIDAYRDEIRRSQNAYIRRCPDRRV